MRIAIVGSGIAGLTAAYHLSPRHQVTLFERSATLGGHSNTVAVRDEGRELGLDTGFIVYNERTYPELTRLLAELGVATQESEMSFSMRCDRCAIEWCGRSVRGLFANPRQLVRPSHYAMLLDVVRFHREARAALAEPGLASHTLGEFLRERKYSRGFVRHYLLPMGAAIWSSTTGGFEDFPLLYFLGFFRNHGLLSLRDQPAWRTVSGGSRRTVEALTRRFADRIRVGCEVQSIRRRPNDVELRAGGATALFDHVILAAHSDQALAMLADADRDEREILGELRYRPNLATLHWDSRRLSHRAGARASWNVHVEDCSDNGRPLAMTYYLNRLQRLDSRRDYCVTLNAPGAVDPDRVLARIAYDHPVYSLRSLAARRRLQARNGARRTSYCGAWLGFGFHEDGVRSALDIVRGLEKGRAAA